MIIMNKRNIVNMKNGTKIATCKWRRICEASLEILFQLIAVYISYLLFNLLGEFLLGEKYQPETAYSLLLLPTLYVLKGAHIIISPYFVEVKISETEVSATTGILTKKIDKLSLGTIENIEVTTTIIGRVFNYSTILLSAYGSWVRLPFIKNPQPIIKDIEINISNLKNKG